MVDDIQQVTKETMRTTKMKPNNYGRNQEALSIHDTGNKVKTRYTFMNILHHQQ